MTVRGLQLSSRFHQKANTVKVTIRSSPDERSGAIPIDHSQVGVLGNQ
eukprot:CAMPEP_0171736638 /NCGR_PEP_ID=MMETSP0991-20121206/32390_1 /TAXON_ID=483369 /ORGANISM="non described non described, Strain CCMP2098" /LENGTH=47 /DNA_ID= /DNA_START= /DNA_END= /DNA_ORIENTATION=